jgi:soluble lytic murein transglycosylase-like protein
MADNMVSSLVSPVTTYQIGDDVPWASWEANLFGAASEFRSYDVISSVSRALDSYKSLYTRVEDRDYTKSELVAHLYTVCDRFNLDKVIAYNQIQAESSFNPKATGAFCVLGAKNKKCGLGIAQFIPATGLAYGLNVNAEPDERLDPIKSLSAYGAYMRDLLNTFDNDYLKALAAYNAGPGTVQGAVKRSGEAWLGSMPSETQVYVVKILGSRATSDPAILQSVQQSIEKGQTTKIGVMDMLFSDLGPDLLKRWALYFVGVVILAVVLLRVYKEYKP